MEIVGYKKEYKDGVIACLKRNYDSMKSLSDEYLGEWIKPITEYSWVNDIPNERYPYKHGMVLLENDNVVGYCGLIYSYINLAGEQKVYVNGTTWAIDEAYRGYVLKLNMLFRKTADVVSDFTPISSVEEINRKVFKLDYLEKEVYKYFPIPTTANKLKKEIIDDPNSIEYIDVQRKLIDHKKHGVKCLKCTNGDQVLFVFYKRIIQKLKNIDNIPFVQLLESSDPVVCSKNLHEIVWYLQKKEKALFETDGRLIDKTCIDYKPIRVSKAHRQVSGIDTSKYVLSNLYSEMAILELG